MMTFERWSTMWSRLGAGWHGETVFQVAATHQPVIVRRAGTDLAAVISLEHLAILQEILAQQEAERLAAQVDWAHVAQTSPPSPQWFAGDEPKPF